MKSVTRSHAFIVTRTGRGHPISCYFIPTVSGGKECTTRIPTSSMVMHYLHVYRNGPTSSVGMASMSLPFPWISLSSWTPIQSGLKSWICRQLLLWRPLQSSVHYLLHMEFLNKSFQTMVHCSYLMSLLTSADRMVTNQKCSVPSCHAMPFEHFIQAMKKSLWAGSHDRLNLHLSLANFLLQYRTTLHATTAAAPCALFLGRKLWTRLDLLNLDLERQVRDRKVSQKVQHDCPVCQGNFSVIDLVMARNFRPGPRWVPGLVYCKFGPRQYLIKMPDDNMWLDTLTTSLGGKREEDDMPDEPLQTNGSNVMCPPPPFPQIMYKMITNEQKKVFDGFIWDDAFLNDQPSTVSLSVTVKKTRRLIFNFLPLLDKLVENALAKEKIAGRTNNKSEACKLYINNSNNSEICYY